MRNGNLAAIASALALSLLVQPEPVDGLQEGQSLAALGSTFAWRINQAGEPGVLSGLVLADDGTPLEGAQVVLDGHLRGGQLTDGDGRFRLEPPEAGNWVLRVMRIAFQEATTEILIPHDRGAFVSVILQPTRMHGLCGTTICKGTRCDDLSVEVVDAETGMPPPGDLTLRIEREGITWENTIKADDEIHPMGLIGLGRRVETEGVHSIEVEVAGYETWRVDGVELELVPGCVPLLLNREHVARLVRKTRR